MAKRSTVPTKSSLIRNARLALAELDALVLCYENLPAPQIVKIIVDGALEEFYIRPDSSVSQNERLFTADFVEAVRKAHRWPKDDEVLCDNERGLPCFRRRDDA